MLIDRIRRIPILNVLYRMVCGVPRILYMIYLLGYRNVKRLSIIVLKLTIVKVISLSTIIYLIRRNINEND